MKTVVLCGGPHAGEVYAVRDVNMTLYTPVPEQIDITSAMDMSRQFMTSVRKASYRARRIASTGHPVHNAEQQVLFDFEGIS